MLVISREELEAIVEAAVARGLRAGSAPSDPEILTRDEAAKLMGMHPDVLVRYVRREQLPAFKVGPEWRFRRSELVAWLETRAVAPGAHTSKRGKQLRLAKGGR
jgi:excisionase family DNA binding protein